MNALGFLIRGAGILGVLLGVCGGASAERLALVIGNDDYANVPKLSKATGDAEAMKTVLEKLGFAVTLAKNLDRDAFGGTLDAFAAKVDVGDEAILFYAGHGIALDGRNFLLPTDIQEPQPGQERRVTRSSYDAGELVDAIREKKPKFVFAVLDACRNNPFEGVGRSVGLTRGLARMEAEPGSFILFSAGPGETALDRLGNDDQEPTSVFTRILLRHIGTPGLTLQGIAKATQRHVRDLALTVNHRQFPDYSDRMSDEPVLVAGSAAAPVDATWNRQAADTAIRLALLDRSPEALARILRDYPGHPRIGEVLDLLEAREDDAAFAKAKEIDTTEAYEGYRRDWPRGRNIAAVDKAISALKAPPPLGALRMQYERAANAADQILAVAISSDGRLLATGNQEGGVKVWDLGKGRLLEISYATPDADRGIASVAFSPDGKVLAVGWTRNVRLFDVETGRILAWVDGHRDWVKSLAFSKDGRELASASDLLDVSMITTRLATRQTQRSVASKSSDNVAFSPDLHLMATQPHNSVKVEETRTGKVVRLFDEFSNSAMAFSPDGRILAAPTRDSIQLWEVETGKPVQRVPKRSKITQAIAFSPDGRVLAAADERTMKLWDAATSAPLHTVEHAAIVSSLAFSADGLFLASGAGGSEDIDTQRVKSGDGVRLTEPKSGRALAEIHALPGKEWVFMTEEGYVTSSGADRYLRVVREGNETPVDDAFKKRWLKESLPFLAAIATSENSAP